MGVEIAGKSMLDAARADAARREAERIAAMYAEIEWIPGADPQQLQIGRAVVGMLQDIGARPTGKKSFSSNVASNVRTDYDLDGDMRVRYMPGASFMTVDGVQFSLAPGPDMAVRPAGALGRPLTVGERVANVARADIAHMIGRRRQLAPNARRSSGVR